MILIELVAFFVLLSLISKQSRRIGRLESLLSESEREAPRASTQSAQPGVHAKPLSAEALSRPEEPAAAQPAMAVAEHAEASSGKLLAVIGIAAVFIGAAFFLKYAFDNDWISPVGRVMLGALAGLAFLGLGQSLRKKYLEYSGFLSGGGLALLYLSAFSAHAFYHLVDPFTAWLLMALITGLGFAVALLNDTLNLGVVALIGGFVTPFLAYSQGDNMLPLFGYLVILDLFVLGIAFYKKWPHIDVVAFIGTLLNFGAWFASYYDPGDLSPTLSFCFFVSMIFIAAGVVRRVRSQEAADQPDYFLMAAPGAFLAVIGYVVLEPSHHAALAPCSLLMAAIYLGISIFMNKEHREDRPFNIFLAGLAVTFLSLAVPLQFHGPWIAVLWLGESLALYCAAVWGGNRGFQVMGAVMYVLGIFAYLFWAASASSPMPFTPFFNPGFMVLAFAIVVAYAIAYIYKRYGSVTTETQAIGISAFSVVANVITVYAVTLQIAGYYGGFFKNESNTAISIFWTLYAALLTAIGFSKRIAGVRRLGLILFVVTAFKVLVDVWSLGQIYRIVSLITFGVIALVASFAYAKYKDRLKAAI